jgi:hypothetical protein
MTQPFLRTSEPEIPRPFKRRFQPNGMQFSMRDTWNRVRRHGADVWRSGKRHGAELWRSGKRHGVELWRQGKRHPRIIGMIGGAAALTLVGGYTLSATGSGRSLCATALETGSSGSKKAKTPRFLVLMEPVGAAAAGSDLEVRYDVCGLPSGSAYRGRLQITQQRVAKKGSAKPKTLMVNFKDEVDGVATRREREVELRNLKPGAYTLEITVTDARGRERKSLQKIRVTSR